MIRKLDENEFHKVRPLFDQPHLGFVVDAVTTGLATFTASAFAEHCLLNNLEAHWDSWADNAPSIRVAEKVGFEKVLDYHVYQGQ